MTSAQDFFHSSQIFIREYDTNQEQNKENDDCPIWEDFPRFDFQPIEGGRMWGCEVSRVVQEVTSIF